MSSEEMMPTTLKTLIFALLVTAMFSMVASVARADYFANGKFWGLECKFFVMCNKEFVDAVDAGEGLHTINNLYPEEAVNEYNESLGICHVKLKPSGVFGWAAGIFGLGPAEFYKLQSDGSYRKVAIDTLSFNCQKK